MSANRIYVFKRFERFWHWTQAALIVFMMFTGFEIHGAYASSASSRPWACIPLPPGP